jgi:hypothetical protein
VTQIVPAILSELITDKEGRKTERVIQALMKMVKLDIKGLRDARVVRRRVSAGEPRRGDRRVLAGLPMIGVRSKLQNRRRPTRNFDTVSDGDPGRSWYVVGAVNV